MQISTVAQQTMSTREIAELLEKQHGHIKVSAERLAAKGTIALRETPYIDPQNKQTYTEYLLNKRDSLILVAQNCPEFTAKIVDRWQELEEASQYQVPQTRAGLLRLALEQEEKIEAQALLIEQQRPFAEFGNAVSASATDVLVGDWIKAINDGGLRIGRNKAFQWFRANGYLGDRNMPMQKYIDQGLFKVKEGLINIPGGQRATFTTMLTGKGQVYFANKLTSQA